MASTDETRPLDNKLVTLIGGGGFIGRYVAQALFKAGARVRVAQRDPRQAFFLRPLGGLGQSQFVAADVARPETIVRAVADADMAVNLVGAFGGNLTRTHVEGARAVGEAAVAAGLGALVHVSAIGADPEASSVYARTKGQGEQAIRSAFAGTTILRPSTVFGREDQFVNRFAGMISKLPVVPVLKGDARFQPVFVGDVAKAVAAALSDAETFAGRTFELGGPEVMTMEELHREIADMIGRHPPLLLVPDAIGSVIAKAPGTPISTDQWKLLERGSVVSGGAEGLEALGVARTPLGAVAPGWLVRFRKAGRFARIADARG